MNIFTPLAPAMLSRKHHQTGDVLTVELFTPIINTILVNRRTPIWILIGVSAKRILKEEKVKVILEHLQKWQ